MKPTHIVVVKTESNGDFMSVNSQDLKTVQINPERETATIVTSSAKATLTCMTRHRLERFTSELRSRYNMLHLPSMKAETTKQDNTILVIEQNGVKTYIWPKALFSVLKRGPKLTITAFGDMKLEIDDPNGHVRAEDITKFDGFMKI